MTMVVPQELATEILSCLPVKSLLRFKCACSSWYHLINSPFFVNSHVTRVSALNVQGSHNYTILTESTNPVSDPHPPRLSLVSGDTFHPIRDVTLPYFGEFGFDASCPYNGLFCLIGKEHIKANTFFSDDVALWNPGTRKLEILPDCPFVSRELLNPPPYGQYPRRRYNVVAFGFGAISSDSDSDYDYKVVTMVRDVANLHNRHHYAYVYSSKKNCWTEVSQVPPQVFWYVTRDGCAAYHNGSYYWLCCNGITLLSFDMHSHVFHVSSVPITLPGNRRYHRWMVNFDVQNDSLAIVVQCEQEATIVIQAVYTKNGYHGRALTGWYEIWVLDEVCKTWSHTSRVENYPFMRRKVCINGTIIGYDGIGYGGDHLVSYNPETQEQKRIKVYYGRRNRFEGRSYTVVLYHGYQGHPFTIVPFVESLVSVNRGESLSEESGR